MADLDNKLQACDQMANLAKAAIELNSNITEMQNLIGARLWTTTGAPTDAQLLSRGWTQAQIVAFVGFMTQYQRFMSNQTVTTTNGSLVCNAIRSL